MTSVRQNHVTTMSTSSHDNNLDALLEELQTSVSRPGSAMNGTLPLPSGMTGYREVTRTVTTEADGGQPRSHTDYHIEYLNPSNQTTVIRETSPHRQLLQDAHNTRNAGYKTVQYEYNTSSSGSGLKDGGLPVADARMRQNITELDSLLDDLNTAQRSGFSESKSTVTRHATGIDPGLMEPIDPLVTSGHVSRVDKRTTEQRYGSVGGRASPQREVKRELVFTGGHGAGKQQPSPGLARKEIYRYESKTTRSSSGGSRDLSPPQDRRQPSPSPARQLASVRSYNYSSSDDVPRTPTMHRSQSPGGLRSSTTTTTSRNYNNREFSPEGRQPPMRSPSPTSKVTAIRNYYNNTPVEPPRTSSKTTTSSYSYNTNTRESRQEVPRSPPPHRSPSPVSFASPPTPPSKSATTKSYFEQNTSHTPYVRPQSPQPLQKFSPSDPSRTLTYQVSPPPSQPTVITYKYTSQTTHSTKFPEEREREGAPLLPRPFPTPSPTPETQQQPPKKLDELMASFSDTDVQHYNHESSRYITPVREPLLQRTEAPPPAPPSPSPPSNGNANNQMKSRNISGPPVYYPPGVDMFSKKEEAMMQSSQSGGGKWSKSKAKYEYEASSKSKSKESSGKTVVPVCLPVCCAMPCVIL